MIKVIASDMDGTLLGNDHKVAPETLKAIHEACDAGIRFMIATGRNFKGAMEELKETDIVCDYIVGSGAEVRDQKQQIVSTAPLSMELCEEIYENLKEFPVSIIFSSGDYDYRIGTKKEIEESFLKLTPCAARFPILARRKMRAGEPSRFPMTAAAPAPLRCWAIT